DDGDTASEQRRCEQFSAHGAGTLTNSLRALRFCVENVTCSLLLHRRGSRRARSSRVPSAAVTAPPPDPALRLDGVSVVRPPTTILDRVDWTVCAGERWVVLGPNGSGKTTLMRLAALYLHPSSGTVDVLGHRLGRVDVRRLRTRIGFVSPAFADLLRPEVTAVDAVMTAREAALETWWHSYGPEDRRAALALLDRTGAAGLA